MRSYMRDITMGHEPDESIATSIGMTGQEVQDMYRLLAIAKYDERYVIPPAHAEQAHSLEELATECSLDYEGGPGMGMSGSGPFGEGSGAPTPIAVENFQMLQRRQTATEVLDPEDRPRRVNLLNWDGKGRPPGLFPRSKNSVDGGAAASADDTEQAP
jgi:nitrate reductase beta subunit